MLYKHILKPILFRFDPEAVHDFFTAVGQFSGKHALTRALIKSIYNYRGPDISKTVDGITYRTPFLLSAGFDYNAQLIGILDCIGFGGEEAGSVTARPCVGNQKPRLTRLPKSESILVNKGLRNEGVDKIIERLKKGKTEKRTSQQIRRRADGNKFVVGVSIARTNDEQSVPIQAGIDDYVYSFKRLNEENIGDYYAINISCPNSFGGEVFATPELLARLLSALNTVPCVKPVYVKMPINISWGQFDSLLKVIDAYGLHGVIIGNLNKNYNSLDARADARESFEGGLSGKPCTRLSTDLIYKTRQQYGNRFTIIGVGGVMSPETAMEKFEAGADLVQVISGLIFEGPGLIKRLGKAYKKSKVLKLKV